MQGFPGGSVGKESACNAGDPGSIPGLGRSPGDGNGKPTPVFCPEEFHGLYSPWVCKQSDMTERLSHSTSLLGSNLYTHDQSWSANTNTGVKREFLNYVQDVYLRLCGKKFPPFPFICKEIS